MISHDHSDVAERVLTERWSSCTEEIYRRVLLIEIRCIAIYGEFHVLLSILPCM